jgi:hypothetical protein
MALKRINKVCPPPLKNAPTTPYRGSLRPADTICRPLDAYTSTRNCSIHFFLFQQRFGRPTARKHPSPISSQSQNLVLILLFSAGRFTVRRRRVLPLYHLPYRLPLQTPQSSFHHQDLSPQHQRQRIHLSRYPERSVVTSVDHLERYCFHLFISILTPCLTSWLSPCCVSYFSKPFS